MAVYATDGKKLINVEYDVIIEINDIVDGMRVLSIDKRSDEEYAVFLLEANTKVTCYIFDEVFIIGKADSYDNLIEAVEAWNNNEI